MVFIQVVCGPCADKKSTETGQRHTKTRQNTQKSNIPGTGACSLSNRRFHVILCVFYCLPDAYTSVPPTCSCIIFCSVLLILWALHCLILSWIKYFLSDLPISLPYLAFLRLVSWSFQNTWKPFLRTLSSWGFFSLSPIWKSVGWCFWCVAWHSQPLTLYLYTCYQPATSISA